MTLTTVILGGTVYDGSGAPGDVADVGIEGDRVALVVPPGTLPAAPGAQVVSASGLAVVPGFINSLSHAWGSLQIDGSGASDLLQGVTTEVFGEAYSLGPSDERMASMGSDLLGTGETRLDFAHLADGLGYLETCGIALNVASHVGGHNLRLLGAGHEDRPLTATELDRLVGVMREEMEDGALGIGTALIYPPGSFATTDELVAICGPVGEYGGTYISHLRSEGDQLLECLDELLDIGRRAGCRTEVYHLKAAGRSNWTKMAQAIERLEAARASGQSVGANMYPYTAGGTMLAASIPPRFHAGGRDALLERLGDPAQRLEMAAMMREPSDDFENLLLAATPDGVRFVADLADGTPAAGMTLTEVSAALGIADPVAGLLEIVARSYETGVLYFVIDEAGIELGLSRPWVSLGSDAAAHRSVAPWTDDATHPRTYGTFSRFLGRYVREHGVTTFADAVRRLTRLPAEGFGLAGRGRIEPGWFADVVVLDPASVSDQATYDEPHLYATGIKDVLVNGVAVVRDGVLLDARPGRHLRRGREQ